MNLKHELNRCVTLFIAANILQNQVYVVTGDEISVDIGNLYKTGD